MANAATGAVERTLKDKLGEIPDLRDFGAVMNGSTDDTQALQKFINYAGAVSVKAIGRAVVTVTGDTVLDYAALDVTPAQITLRVNGNIRCKSTFVINANICVVGGGGNNNNNVQFNMGPCCSFVNYTGLAGPIVQCLHNSYLEGVTISGGVAGHPALLIGRRLTDPPGNPPDGRQTANIRLDRVGVNSVTAGVTAAIKIENTFWLWINHFSALKGNGGPSIWIADSYFPGSGNNNSGLIDIRNGVISSGGIWFGTPGADETGQSGQPATGYHYWFDQIHYENVAAGEAFFYFKAKQVRSDLRISRCAMADPILSRQYGADGGKHRWSSRSRLQVQRYERHVSRLFAVDRRAACRHPKRYLDSVQLRRPV